MKKVLLVLVSILFASQAFAELRNCKINYPGVPAKDLSMMEIKVSDKFNTDIDCPVNLVTVLKFEKVDGKVINSLIGKINGSCQYSVPKFVENDAFATISCESH